MEDLKFTYFKEKTYKTHSLASGINGVNGIIGCASATTESEETGSEEMTVPEYHPLFVEVVLHKVFEFSTVESLYTCRRVCKAWSHSAMEHLMKKKSFQLSQQNVESVTSSLNLLSLKETTWSPAKIEFSGFTFNDHRHGLTTLLRRIGTNVKELSLNFQDLELQLQDLERTFLMNVPNIEYLALDSLPCDFFSDTILADGYESVLYSGRLPVFRKLKSIKLGTRCHYVSESTIHLFFMGLLSLAPNLEKLEGLVDWLVPKLVKTVDILHMPWLNHLELRGAFNEETARTLEKFHLKTFYLGVSGHYNDDIRHNVLYQQRLTLQTLGLGWASFKSRVHIEDIRNQFPSLAYLSLCDSSLWDSDRCPSIYCTGEGIRKLHADIRNPADFIYLLENANAFSSVMVLDISFLNRFMIYDLRTIVTAARNMFPGVTVLTLRVGHDFPIGLVFQLFSQLEELTLVFDKSSLYNRDSYESCVITEFPFTLSYLDPALTGLTARACQELRECPLALAQKVQQWNTFGDGFTADNLELLNPDMPNDKPLSNLKELRKLVIKGGPSRVSHVVVELCLLRMKKLTSVTIQPAAEFVFSVLKEELRQGTYLEIEEIPIYQCI